jgi:hypothetical protein
MTLFFCNIPILGTSINIKKINMQYFMGISRWEKVGRPPFMPLIVITSHRRMSLP